MTKRAAEEEEEEEEEEEGEDHDYEEQEKERRNARVWVKRRHWISMRTPWIAHDGNNRLYENQLRSGTNCCTTGHLNKTQLQAVRRTCAAKQ